MFKEVTDIDEDELLASEAPSGLNYPHMQGYPAPQQNGPVRWFSKEMRCASRGCGSSTFGKLQGVPRCWTHMCDMLNEMLIELGVTE